MSILSLPPASAFATRSVEFHDAAAEPSTGPIFDVSGYAAAAISVTGTFSGARVMVRGRFAPGDSLVPLAVAGMDGEVAMDGIITAPGIYWVDTTAIGQLSARVDEISSGAVSVSAILSRQSAPVYGALVGELRRRLPSPFTTIHHSGATSNGSGTSANVAGYASALIEVTGTFDARVVMEGRYVGGGASWPIPLVNAANGDLMPSGVITEPGAYRADVAGYEVMLARITDYTSGSVTVRSRVLNTPAQAPNASSAGEVRYDKDNPLGTASAASYEIRDTGQKTHTIYVPDERVFDHSIWIDSSLDAPLAVRVIPRFRGVGGSLATSLTIFGPEAPLQIGPGGTLGLLPSLSGVPTVSGGRVGDESAQLVELGLLREPVYALSIITQALSAPTTGEISIQHVYRK